MKSLKYNDGIILFNIPEISRRGQAVNMQYFHGEIILPWKPSRDRVNIHKFDVYKKIPVQTMLKYPRLSAVV
jgi:hypothetical protein